MAVKNAINFELFIEFQIFFKLENSQDAKNDAKMKQKQDAKMMQKMTRNFASLQKLNLQKIELKLYYSLSFICADQSRIFFSFAFFVLCVM